MVTDPSGFTVRIQGLLDRYSQVCAHARNCDHSEAQRLLDQISDLCNRACLLHEKEDLVRMDGGQIASPRVRTLIDLANIGYETKGEAHG